MGIKRIIILPDTHIPDHNEHAINAVIQFILDWKPDYLIHLGDLCDFASLSRFRVASAAELKGFAHEVKETNKFLDLLDQILPTRCKKVITLGNHDQRPEIYALNNWDASAMKLLGMSKLPCAPQIFNLKERGWKVVPYGSIYTLGKANFTHGYFINKYHAQKTVSRFFKNIYYGHTHDVQSHCVVGMDGLPVEAMSLGTLQRTNPIWLRGTPVSWVPSFSTMYLYSGGKYNLYPTKIINGGFVAEGKYYHG
jgi:predicted phosphodiesterase